MISSPGQRPPYPGTAGLAHAPNAALLIDFDNVTMGIRSDLGKELKALLNSDVIRGKVAVQRAYADWRRYPQYIVPLAESSVDLIFAPAYGSSKKNATDLRMAIDAIELVFTRPEIGTYILMTGDSDFSSCVLKLKEYGKYVIGVGMRESSSDLLVQNCDEYYSYHSLSGLTRAGEIQESSEDPWVLVRRAAQQMVTNGDVMRTDRLKQVMLDIDPGFDEKKIGYSKFSRFVQEAANKGMVRLRKGENGQFEIVTVEEKAEAAAPAEAESTSSSDRRRGRGRDRDRERDGRRDGRRDSRPRRDEGETTEATQAPAPTTSAQVAEPVSAPAAPDAQSQTETPAERTGSAVDFAYSLLQAAVRELVGRGGKSVRDGDVKRRMLDMSPGFDESELGFSKFTRFLRQAHDAEVIDLERSNGGNYDVSLPASGKRLPPPALGTTPSQQAVPEATGAQSAAAAVAEPVQEAAPSPVAEAEASAQAPATESRPAVGVGALRGRRGGRPGAPEGPPPILPGQVVAPAAIAATDTAKEEPAAEKATAPAEPTDSAVIEASEEAKKKTRRGRRGRGKGRSGEADAAASDTKSATAAAPRMSDESSSAAAAMVAAAEKLTPIPEGPIDKITARARRARALRGDADERATAPPILPGQAVTPPTREHAVSSEPATPAATSQEAGNSAVLANLPKDRAAVIAHLSSYRGVGKKTAETLFDAFEEKVYDALQSEHERIRELIGPRRSTTVLEQWAADRDERVAATGAGGASEAAGAEEPAKADEKRSGKAPARGGRGRSRAAQSATAKAEKGGEEARETATAAAAKKPRARGGTKAKTSAAAEKKPASRAGSRTRRTKKESTPAE